MDLSITSHETGVTQDTRWRISTHGEDAARPGQLDVSTLATAHYLRGIVPGGAVTARVPSGLALGQITATKLYGPYDPDATDGREKLAGFLNDNVGVEVPSTTSKPMIAVLTHAIVKASVLPVPAQRTSVLTADSTGSFIFVED